MSLYKYMYILCKNLEFDNSAKGLLELQFHPAILPSYLMVSLIQNRSVNSRTEPNTNISVDLCRSMKTRGSRNGRRPIGGNLLKNTIGKISKASNVTRTMVEQLKVSTKLHQCEVGVHTQKFDQQLLGRLTW